MAKRLTKQQVAEVLREHPMHEVLNVQKSKLTPKMARYCEERARGETKAGSYRKAYNSKAKPATQANNGYQLEKRDDIQTMIEAVKRGIEWSAMYSLSQTRALVVERLTKEALDDASSPSARINALKALGTVAGVDAFIHRTETKVIKDSDTAKAELMAKLKTLMGESIRTVNEEPDADELELLRVISSAPDGNGEGETPPTPDPTFLQDDGTPVLHSNPDK